MAELTDWFPVFRAGTHTDASGRTSTFTQGDLDGMAARCDPASDPVPCVIEHDALYSPFGYAHVAELRRDGDLLMARCDPATVEPQFAALVAEGRLDGRSVELLPAADGYRVGHVAFLGAAPPAVEGLAPIRLSARGLRFASESGWEEVERLRTTSRLLRAVRELAVRVFGEDADRVVGEWELERAAEDVGAARERAARETTTSTGGEMSQFTQDQLDAAVKAATDEQQRQFQAQQRTLEERQRAFARQDAEQRVAALIDQGRLTPAQAEGAAEFACALDAGAELRFSRGEGAAAETIQTSPQAWFWQLLGKLPKQFSQGTLAGPGSDPGAGTGAGGLTGQELHRRALAFQASESAAGRRIDIMAAIEAVSQQQQGG